MHHIIDYHLFAILFYLVVCIIVSGLSIVA
jgi:hypothetical protein